nr:hypothetical protein [Tanacetum cinerariifolium]
MARLAFCDYHNMIAILEKYEHNVNFHLIVDFVEASYIRVETSDEGTKILATIDGKPRTISKSSIRRNLKLNDEAGINSLPDAELFENLTLMGYNISPNQKFTFQKGFNEFSSNIATAVVCFAINRVYNFSKMIFDDMVRNVNNKVSKFLMYPRVNNPSFLGRIVPLFDSMLVLQDEGSGTPTEPHYTPSPEAPQSPQHDLSSSIHPPVTTKTIPTVTPTDIPTLRQYSRRARIAQVPSLAGDEGSMQHKLNELTDLCTRLQRQQTEMAFKITTQDLEIISLKARIKMLEDKDGGVAEPSREDATIKGRNLETGEEASVDKSTERGSNDTKELVNVLTSLDAGSILTSGVQVVSVPPAAEVATVSVPTGSGMVPTASLKFTTASVVTPYSRGKGKEKMVESDTAKKKKLQEQIDVRVAREMEEQIAREDLRMNGQIARDVEIARIHAEEELRMLIDGLDRNNETVAKYLQEYEQFATDLSIGERIELINDLVKYQDNYAKVHKYRSQQRKPLSKKQQREFYILKILSPWVLKKKRERVKRKGLRLEHESAKKVKTSEEVSKEDLKIMMQLVPVEEVYVEALQVKHPIIDWEIHTEAQRNYWKIIRLGGNTTTCYSDKEKELWVELKRLYESDVEDQPWIHTQALMHDPVEWRLYDSCCVHHVLSRDQEIFMLVKRDYPLRKGLAIVMISHKLQVKNYSQMANDLILKIHKNANSPRQRDD